MGVSWNMALGSMVVLSRPLFKCMRNQLDPFYKFYWSCPLLKRCWSRRFCKMWSSLEILSQPHIWRHLLWFLSSWFISFCRPKGVLCLVQRTCVWDERIFNGNGLCVRWTLAKQSCDTNVRCAPGVGLCIFILSGSSICICQYLRRLSTKCFESTPAG